MTARSPLRVPAPVFSDRARALGWLYVAVIGAAGAIGAGLAGVAGEHDYLVTWLTLSGLLLVPALALTARASRTVAPPDRAVWRLWLAGLGCMYVIGSGVLHVVRHQGTPLRQLGVVAVAVATLVFEAAALRMMRRRAGHRSVALDAVEVLMVSTLLLGGVTLLVGEAVVTSPAAWFAIPCLLTANGVVTGLVWAGILHQRLPRDDRALGGLAIALGVAAVVDCAAHLAQALHGFTLPAGPLLAVHAATMGLLVLLPLHASRLPSAAAEPWTASGEAVRGSRALTALVLAGLPVLLAATLVVDERLPWADAWFIGVLAVLVVLAALRNLLASHETGRPYADLAVAADKDRRLLADVMRTVDGERRQAAAQLHRQAVASYSIVSLLAADPAEQGATGGDASARLRHELERAAEAFGDLVHGARPAVADEPWPARLATGLRAQVAGAPGSASRPEVTVEVEPGIDLDWTTETLVVQLLQAAASEALAGGARRLRVHLSAGPGGLDVVLLDDRRSALAGDGSAREAMEAIVALADGRLDVRHRPGLGTTTTAGFGRPGAPPAARHPLRLVPPPTD